MRCNGENLEMRCKKETHRHIDSSTHRPSFGFIRLGIIFKESVIKERWIKGRWEHLVEAYIQLRWAHLVKVAVRITQI